MKKLILAVLFFTTTSWASFVGFDNVNGQIGHFNDLACSAEFSCTQSSGQFLLDITSLNLTGDSTFGGVTPYLTMGDAGAEDTGFVFDGNAQDYNISLDDTADDLVIGFTSTSGILLSFGFFHH